MKRDKCIVCGAKLHYKPIYICERMPAVSQDLPTKEEIENDKAVDFELCQCTMCGLVQFNNEPVYYYRDSTRAGEQCDFLVNLRKKQYKHLIETYNLQGKKLVEIGAGKGGFLKTLTKLPEYNISEYGIEYNEDFVRIAREIEHVNVQQGNPECESTVIDGAPFDAFTSFAYPARLINPNAMMQCVYNNTTDDVVGLIMVPSMEHLLSAGGYFDITADHIAYYDINSLRFMLQKNGFEIIEHGEVADIYIYAYVRKIQKYNLDEIWSGISDLSKQVSEYIRNEKRNGKKIAVWCAGHFAFTLLAMLENYNDIEYIIDNAEFKKNRYSPATHILIMGPEFYAENPVDSIMILGPMYVEEIVKEIHDKCSKQIRISKVDKNGLQML